MSSNLKQRLIRLGDERPELRDHLRPIIATVEKVGFFTKFMPCNKCGFEKKVEPDANIQCPQRGCDGRIKGVDW